MDDRVITYELAGQIFTALRHFCLQCDKPVVIAVSEMKENGLFFCTFCGLGSRMPLSMIDETTAQLAELVEQRGSVQSVPGKHMN